MQMDETPLVHAPQLINELAAALSKAQAKITDAEKNSRNPHFNKSYADLASVWEACRAPLSENGLSVIQTIEPFNGSIFLETTLAHASGQFIKSRTPLIMSKQDMQGMGSALTYARRYALAAIVGVAQEDDDGNSATGKPKKPEEGAAAYAAASAAKAAQNVQKKDSTPPKSAAKTAPPVAKTATPPTAAAFNQSEGPALKRPRGAIVKDIMAAAAKLDLGKNSTPPTDDMTALERMGKMLFQKDLEKTNDDELEKMLSRLKQEMVGK